MYCRNVVKGGGRRHSSLANPTVNPLLWDSKVPSEKDAAPDKATTEQLNSAANSLQAKSYTLRVKVSLRA